MILGFLIKSKKNFQTIVYVTVFDPTHKEKI